MRAYDIIGIMKGVFIWFVIVFLLIGGFWYWNNKQGENFNLPFSGVKQNNLQPTSTPTPAPPQNSFSQQVLEILIKDYLAENLLKPNFGGKIFCDYYLYGYNDQTAYLWAHCEEYYPENNQLKIGSGLSQPLKLELTGRKEVPAIVNHTFIEDGKNYEQSLRNNFPEELANQALPGYPQEKLTNSPHSQAEVYFKIN